MKKSEMEEKNLRQFSKWIKLQRRKSPSHWIGSWFYNGRDFLRYLGAKMYKRLQQSLC